jgi:23S rRNA (uracil1939-C5)-methyltransferase
MTTLTLTLTDIAHGGSAVGRDADGRPVFVPYAIPGEQVRVAVTQDKGRFARADLLELLQPSPDRVAPRCPHFGLCGGCHFQHVAYARQLQLKRAVVVDQLQRIGGFKQVDVPPTRPHPQPWDAGAALALSPAPGGGLGLWAPRARRVLPIETCHIVQPALRELLADVDLELPGLRRLTLRVDSAEQLLAALEVEDVEPPALTVDFPLSVAIVLPDQTAAALIGDPYLVYRVRERDFRVSPGCFFHPSPATAELLLDALLELADLRPHETVLELYSGVGTFTAFLAEAADAVAAVESNPDAVEDAAANLADTDNVSVLLGAAEEIVPLLDVQPDVLVAHPDDDGLPAPVLESLRHLAPRRLLYVSSDIATLARDGRALARLGYRLSAVQPVDGRPQTYHVDTVSRWERR